MEATANAAELSIIGDVGSEAGIDDSISRKRVSGIAFPWFHCLDSLC
jgi:hypothetical protein